MSFSKNVLALINETGILGRVSDFNFITKELKIVDADNVGHTANLDEVTFLEHITTIKEEDGTELEVFDRDVFESQDGKLYEINKVSNGNVQFSLLDKDLEKVETGKEVSVDEFLILLPMLTLGLVGNIHELEVEEEKNVDFNIVVVKINGEFFYACNNKDTEEVDLIKVVFIGANLLEEEEYSRITVSHEEYLTSVEIGEIEESTPQELMSYVRNPKKQETVEVDEYVEEYEDEDFEDEIEEEEDFEDFDEDECDCTYCRKQRELDEDENCEECGKHYEDCECWD